MCSTDTSPIFPKNSRRTFYSEDETLQLLDIIYQYGHIVENKKTDSTTWKEKDQAWERIAYEFNVGKVTGKTKDQLRCKFDNLKKEARRLIKHHNSGFFPLHHMQPAIKPVIYEKVQQIITYSSDTVPFADCDFQDDNKYTLVIPNECIDIDSSKISIPEEHETATVAITGGRMQTLESETKISELSGTGYIPKIKSKKHNLYRSKKKFNIASLKRKLLLREDKRQKEYHTMKMSKESELFDLQIENMRLKNDLLKKSNPSLKGDR